MIHALLLLAAAQDLVVANAPVQRELRMHSVGELISAPSAWPSLQFSYGPNLVLQSQDLHSGLWSIQPRLVDSYGASLLSLMPARDERKFESAGEIEEIATRFCQPPVDPQWERIQADDQGWLVCYLRPEQHDWLENFLRLQREGERQWLAEIETRWFTLPAGALAGMDLPGSAVLLDDEAQAAAMIRQLAERSAEEITAPRITAFPGQRAEISVLNEVSYVKEFHLEIVEPGRQEIADPVVEVIQEGQVMEVRAMQTGDALYGLRISCSSSEVERPIPTRRFKLSPAHSAEVEIALPQVRTAQVDATVLVPDGGGVLLLASGLGEDRDLAIVLRFRRAEAIAEAGEGAR